jgi:hypothetical protein
MFEDIVSRPKLRYWLNKEKILPAHKVLNKVTNDDLLIDNSRRPIDPQVRQIVENNGFYEERVCNLSSNQIQCLEILTQLGYVKKRLDRYYMTYTRYEAFLYHPSILPTGL